MQSIACVSCHKPYPDEGLPYYCPDCRGIYDFVQFPAFNHGAVDPAQPGVWRYRASFALPEDAPVVSLGEGNTPLIWVDFDGQQVALKCEFQNPSGSFKDRGSALIASYLQYKGVEKAVEDSSGNAGSSFSAYAARSGIRAEIYVPDSTSSPKRKQIQAYGAKVIRILGPRSNAAEAVRQAAREGSVYASHAYLPFNLPGFATTAYEIVEQLGRGPSCVIVPVGQGGMLLGMLRGFKALKEAGVIQQVPFMVGVQARECAPLWAAYEYGPTGLSLVTEGNTLAEGIRVRYPVRGDVVMKEMQQAQGIFTAVDEEEISHCRDLLASKGFFVENTSAVVLAAYQQLLLAEKKLPASWRDAVVFVLTGSGLKNLV